MAKDKKPIAAELHNEPMEHDNKNDPHNTTEYIYKRTFVLDICIFCPFPFLKTGGAARPPLQPVESISEQLALCSVPCAL